MGLGLGPEVLIGLGLLLLLVVAGVICWIVVGISVRRKTREIEKKLEVQKALRESAEASNQAKADFLASMSHEIRTPMNAIVGFTDLALKSDISAELRDYLDTVHTSAEWLMHIVNDVLEFSRVEAGRLQLDNEPFSVVDCIQSAVKIVQPEAAAKGLAVRSKIDPQIPAQVCGDFTRLRQVIFNLVSNAVKFTASGSVMISAGLESKSEDAVLVRIAVADTGIGIPLHKRELIFEPFRPAEQNVKGMTGGTGLGLAISHKLVTMMGGTMEFQSQLGAGSTFQFTAWFKKRKAAAEIEEQPVAAQQTPKLLSILVAEDNAVNCRLITKVLESAGHRVRSVANGREAVRVCESETFDLLLMDMEMPEIDGLEATEMIRAAEPAGSHVTIYALTAHILPGDKEKCFAVGMDGFITKPIAVDDVLRLVADVAAGHPQRSYASSAAATEAAGAVRGGGETDEDGIPSQYKKKPSTPASEEAAVSDGRKGTGKSGPLFRPEYASEEQSTKGTPDVNRPAEREVSRKRETVTEMPAPSSLFKDPEDELSAAPVVEDVEKAEPGSATEVHEPESATEVQMTEALLELPKAFYPTEEIREEAASGETHARAADMERNGSYSESRSAVVEVCEPASVDDGTRETLSVAAGLALLETSLPQAPESAAPAKGEDRFATAAVADPFAQARLSLSKARFDIRVIHSDGDPSERNLI